MKKLSLLFVLLAFFFLGNLGCIFWLIFENNKDRVLEYVPVMGFFVIGGCITNMIAAREKRAQDKRNGS